MEIFIPGNVPSSKNSKSKYGVFSKSVQKYLHKLGIQKFSSSKRNVTGYKRRPNLFPGYVVGLREYIEQQDKPIVMYFYFIRDSKRRCDFNNLNQIICDLLQAHRIIEDDSMDYLIPMPLKISGKWYSIDKERAGVIIRV